MAKYLLIVLLTLSLDSAAKSSASNKKVIMTVAPTITERGFNARIDFKFKYIGDEAITINRGNWISDRVFGAISFKADVFPNYNSKQFISCPDPIENIVIDDPGVGTFALAPGTEVVRSVNLRDLYANVSEILGRCELLIYWSYKLDLQPGLNMSRMAGVVIFPTDLKERASEISTEISSND